MGLRISIPASLSAFGSWLLDHPVVGDPTYSGQSLRSQVARYCGDRSISDDMAGSLHNILCKVCTSGAHPTR